MAEKLKNKVTDGFQKDHLRRTPTLYPCRYLKFQPDDKPKLLP